MELLLVLVGLLVGVLWVLYRLLQLLFPFLREQCGVCGKRSMDADEVNRATYNACVDAVGGRVTHQAVCQSCLTERLKTMVCGKCHKTIYNAASPQKEVKNQIKDAKREMDAMRMVCTQLGEENSWKDEKLLCASCCKELKRVAIAEFLSSINREDEPVQPILLHLVSKQDSSHCARCGTTVSEENNFAPQLRAIYGDEAYPYSDFKKECRSFIDGYLHAEAICSSCCWQLRPEHVRADYMFRSKDGWIGGVSGSGVPGYCVITKFDTVAYSEGNCHTIDEVKDKLREKALLTGANGFVDFWDDRRDGFYTGHAIPVTFERIDKVGSHGAKISPQNTRSDSSYSNKTAEATVKAFLPEKLIIDGSNLIRAKGGRSVKGLQSCLEVLKQKGCHVQVFLDANILHVLRDNDDAYGATRLEKLLADAPSYVKMVPAGARADDFILLRANEDGSHILSNDRFEQYMERYPWLKEHRLHKFMFLNRCLMIPDFNIDIEI